MTDRSSSSGTDAHRKVRAHNKSRRGCGNCKLRRVKVRRLKTTPLTLRNSAEPRLQCDETKPQCKKCKAYGVWCSYDREASDLQLFVDKTSNFEVLRGKSHSLGGSGLDIIFPALRHQSVVSLASNTLNELGEQDLELLNKFQARTIPTICFEKNLVMYQTEIVKLACSVRISEPSSGGLY